MWIAIIIAAVLILCVIAPVVIAGRDPQFDEDRIRTEANAIETAAHNTRSFF